MLIPNSTVERVLSEALSTGADFAEIFAEDTYSSTLSVVDSAPKNSVVARNYGAGIRVHFGTEEIYVTTNDLSDTGLIKAAHSAAQARPGGKRAHQPQPFQRFDEISKNGLLPWEITRERKIKSLLTLDREARAKSTHVTQTKPYLIEKIQRVQIANSLGVNVTDSRTNYRLFLDVYVEDAGKTESFAKNLYSTTDPLFYETIDTEKFTTDTVNSALTMLKADYAPAGEMPVILEGGFGGVIFHEACGHGLETTSVAQNASVFCGKLNQKVAEPVVTAIDDGTIVGEWGSLKYDDEGSLTKKTTLIDKGILSSYMADLLGSKKTGYEKTGSSRRESYKYAPTSRMRNTFIAAGSSPLSEMIKDIDYGIYAKEMGGGSVSPGTGDFNFAVQEAYIIRNGRLEEPVKGASLIGRGIEALGRITKVGSELKHAAGMCGSVSGSIPAAVGQPALLVSKILVGGRAK